MTMQNSKLKILFFCIFFISGFLMWGNAMAADIHICDTTVCGQTPGDGSTWSNALNDLPTNLVRGNTYYIADGNYANHTFSDNESGLTYITIKKATVTAHGTDTGWNNTYGDEQAAFSPPLRFTKGFYNINGQEGSGGDSTTYGFIVSQVCPPTATSQLIGIPGIGNSTAKLTYITLSYIAAVSCGFSKPDCGFYSQNPIYSNAAEGYESEHITISHCYLGKGSTLLLGGRANDWIIEDNYFYRNWHTQDDGGADEECQGVDITNGQMYASNISQDWIVRRNIFYDGYTFLNGAHYTPNIRHQIYNNIIIGGVFTAGFSTATQSMTDWVQQWDVYHNTFIGASFTVTTARGVVFPGLMSNAAVDHCHTYNNLFYDVVNPRLDNGYPIGQGAENGVIHDYNSFLSCTAGGGNIPDEDNGQVDTDALATDIFTDYANGDYSLKIGALPINNGKTDLGSTYAYDYAGTERGASPDIGAYEYVGTSDVIAPASPTGLSVS